MKIINIPTSSGDMIGNLFLPKSKGSPFPVVIVAGAWTTVKEQMPNTYAKALAENGYAAITFDFRGWGESLILESPKYRYLEDPYRKSEDIQSVVKAIKGIPELDARRIGGLGICASAGYMSDAVSKIMDIKSLALIAPWLHNAAIVSEAFGGDEMVHNLRMAAKKADASEIPNIIEAASNVNETALMYQKPYYTEEQRGLIPEYDNKFNVASWENWLTFNSIDTAKGISQPVFVVHSEKAAIPDGAKQYLNILGDRGSSLWINDADQFDFYDVDDYIQQSMNAVIAHFDQTL